MSRGLVFMLQSVVLYTSANLLVKALAILPTPQLVFLRSAISFLFCALWIWRKGDPLLGHNRKWLVLRGVSGMIALTLFFHTIRHIPLASATVIQYLSPEGEELWRLNTGLGYAFGYASLIHNIDQ